MAQHLSVAMGNHICRWLAGNAMPSPPAFLEIALFDGDPKGAGVEVTEDITYAGRMPFVPDAIAVGVDNNIVNANAADFGNAEHAVANLSHFAIYDDSGDLVGCNVLTGGPFNVTLGTHVEFLAGQLSITVGS